MDAITESPGRYRPVSHRYDTIDRRYKFFKSSNAGCMQMYYPLKKDETGKYFHRKVHSSKSDKRTVLQQQIKKAPSGCEMDYQECGMDLAINQETFTTINILPDDILLAIFEHFHPMDLINCLSLVSHRWNNLANHPSLFREVRVLVNGNSLAWRSVRHFFERTSQFLRKLCVDCTISLPSVEVNALFDNIRMPNVTHLDISSFEEMNASLLRELSKCFPNIETLHMEGVKRCSENWEKLLEDLFDDAHTFPKIQNFFVDHMIDRCESSGPKLLAWKRHLKVLHVREWAEEMNFGGIATSPWKLTLTVLDLGSYIDNRFFRYIAMLQNLKVLSLDMILDTTDEEILTLKSLHNLEELRLSCGGEDSFLSEDGLIALFTLPQKHPEKSFPYSLKYLALTYLYSGLKEFVRVLDQNCPNLRALSFGGNQFMGDSAIEFIVKNYNQLIFLDLSSMGESYKNEIWNALTDQDLPDLRLLKVHENQCAVEDLQRLNLKRPKLLISTRSNYIINWTETENGPVFHETFDGDINALMNDLCQIEGFDCCGPLTYFQAAFMYGGPDLSHMVRSSSLDTSGNEYPNEESSGTFEHSV